MHELTLCQALITEVEVVARRHRAQGVAGVRLLLGPLSGAEPALLQSAFPPAVAGTRLEGATLSIDVAPVRVACDSCGAESEATPGRLVCTACGDWHTRILSGDDLTLISVDLILEQSPSTEDGMDESAASHV
jgi:hydrogenase nickel incorporation protein HypA/HybF